MKKLLIILSILLPTVTIAQTSTSGTDKKMTKFEEFTSKTGSIIKYVDYKMPVFSTGFFGAGTVCGIRVVIGSIKNEYFYRIEKPESNSSIGYTAMIEYSDLINVNKALTKLNSEVQVDCVENPDYEENKFVTDDGFKIGYYISEGKANWFMYLERYGNSAIFIQNAESVITNFTNAQKKIEELKIKYGK